MRSHRRSALVLALGWCLITAATAAGQDGGERGTLNGRLAFGMEVDGNVDIYSVQPDGRDLRRLTHAPGFDACPAWAPDGSAIVYCAGTEDGTFEIWEMAADGDRQRQVTDLGGASLFPDISPDGTRIVFEAAIDGEPQIRVVARDGDDLASLTSEGGNTSPVWSPDGRRIAFISDRTGDPQVWLMEADGSRQRQVTHDGLAHGAPEWAPDGTHLAYDTFVDDVPQLWIMTSDGTENQRLTDDPAGEGGAAWSPDGTRIAFVSRRVDPWTVYIWSPPAGRVAPAAGMGRQFIPAWQPLIDTALSDPDRPFVVDRVPGPLLGSWAEPVAADGLGFSFLASDDPVCVRLLGSDDDCYVVGPASSLTDPLEYGLAGIRDGRLVMRTVADPLGRCRGAEAEFAYELASDQLTLTAVTPECHGATALEVPEPLVLIRGAGS